MSVRVCVCVCVCVCVEGVSVCLGVSLYNTNTAITATSNYLRASPIESA